MTMKQRSLTRTKIWNEESSDVDVDLNTYSFEEVPNDISFLTLKDIFNNFKETLCDDFVSISGDKLQVSSAEYDGPISKFLILIEKASDNGNYKFLCYNGLLKTRIPFLNKKTVSSISEIEKIVHYVKFYDSDDDSRSKKEEFLIDQITLLNKGSTIPFKHHNIDFALTLYSKSRTSYLYILKVLTLPSTRTLRRITSKVNNLSENEFLFGITSKLTDKQKVCFLFLDEVYVKPGYQYSGSILHGSAEDKKDEKARTILAFMINLFFGGSKFVFKIHPIYTLKSAYLKECICDVMQKLSEANIITKGIIVDNNKVNQRCFNEMSDDLDDPYLLTQNGKKHFLFKDPTHILKC